MRPDQLFRIFFVGRRDKIGREEILRFTTNVIKMTVGPDSGIGNIVEIVSLNSTSIHFRWLIREQTEGWSGAEISSLCQDAAILTMQDDINTLYVSPIILCCFKLNMIRFLTIFLLRPLRWHARFLLLSYKITSSGEMGITAADPH